MSKSDMKCPFFTAGRDELEPCLRERCALWNEVEARCAFWLLGQKVSFEFVEHDRKGELDESVKI